MTRKDYIKLAEVIKAQATFDYPTGVQRIDKDILIDSLADMLEGDNPNFDRQMFQDTCYTR